MSAFLRVVVLLSSYMLAESLTFSVRAAKLN